MEFFCWVSYFLFFIYCVSPFVEFLYSIFELLGTKLHFLKIFITKLNFYIQFLSTVQKWVTNEPYHFFNGCLIQHFLGMWLLYIIVKYDSILTLGKFDLIWSQCNPQMWSLSLSKFPRFINYLFSCLTFYSMSDIFLSNNE